MFLLTSSTCCIGLGSNNIHVPDVNPREKWVKMEVPMVGSGGIYKEEASHPVYALDGRLVHFAILINVGQTVGVGDNKEKFLGVAPTPKIIENYFDQVSFIDYFKNKIFNFFILYISITFL